MLGQTGTIVDVFDALQGEAEAAGGQEECSMRAERHEILDHQQA
jgi:hypothetical protein